MTSNTANNRVVSISEMEQAINYWRQQYPSSRDTMTLCPQASSLAELYARMIIFQMSHIAWAEFSAKMKKAFNEAQTTPPLSQSKVA